MKPDMYEKLEKLGAFKTKDKAENNQLRSKVRKILEPVSRNEKEGPRIEIETL